MQPDAGNRPDRLDGSLRFLMIKVLADSLESLGFSVCASHIGGVRKPAARAGGIVPDIEASRGQEVRLIEVRTEATLDLPETADALAGLAAEASAKVFLAVPSACIEEAERLRESLDVNFTILPCYPFVGYVGTAR
jgi:hypothetical protein